MWFWLNHFKLGFISSCLAAYLALALSTGGCSLLSPDENLDQVLSREGKGGPAITVEGLSFDLPVGKSEPMHLQAQRGEVDEEMNRWNLSGVHLSERDQAEGIEAAQAQWNAKTGELVISGGIVGRFAGVGIKAERLIIDPLGEHWTITGGVEIAGEGFTASGKRAGGGFAEGGTSWLEPVKLVFHGSKKDSK